MTARTRPTPTTAEVAEAAALLGVPAGASVDEVKSAWRAAVRVTHPDRVDANARTAAEHIAAGLNEARDTLLAVAGTRVAPAPLGPTSVQPHPRPATTQPVAARPSTTQPVAARPSTTQPDDTQPIPVAPVTTRSGHTQPAREPIAPQSLVTLPRTVRPGPPPPPTVATHSGKRRPVREAVGILILLGVVGAAAVLVVVYQFLGGLLPN